MTKKKRGLGRSLNDLGLSELLSDVNYAKPVEDPSAAATAVTPVASLSKEAPRDDNRVYRLPVEKIKPGRFQPRQHFDQTALQELADSIKAQGIIQPIVVRRAAEGYELIAGERRWRASQLIGLEHIPAVIQDLPEKALAAIALIENIQREDLNVLEEAQAMDRLLGEFQLTHQEVAAAVGKSRTAVTNLLRLLKLDPEVKIFLLEGQIDMGHARALLALEPAEQLALARLVVKNSLTVRQVEALVKHALDPEKREQAIDIIDPNIKKLQMEIGDRLSAKVMINHKKQGKGQLVIHYNNIDELEGILEHIQ